ncbi:MAG: DegV family protein [Lachnospiraceae bacterium]|jgi:DegV family protein with EDD domain|uniref:DegV family protein n=1 Tax=Hominisplanchenecus murintestinalis TaxID=2941517 RepID=A0AC61QWI2_9FIRM|nr:DegV family protein [Hominisplanchenecus murintestinalis]MCI9517156.1 DegV family protein [Lachnospiraceae bacterium]RKJ90893.1 DegV family protein [Anaerotruncus sp. 1XD22-93]MCI9661582.1 DegV family protein [Lachnospiraceae bacterium]NBH98475.1 DegV family protein [Lachnospiraceae bacterium]NBI75672.1 DegV family protein [Lachnospiraceae bacterium]
MSYRIVIDSCGELTEEMKKSGRFTSAPLTLQVDEHTVVDDETFDQADFLKRVAASPNCPKSSCPSPEAYRDAFDCGVDHAYAVTLSAELSGSYNSAMLGKNLYLEQQPEAKVYVFNSRSASVGETLIGLKIQECEEAGMSFEQVVETVEAYIAGQNTWFVLENLETLRKNGRLSTVKAMVASALKIKPVMGATPEGTIIQLGQARGINRAVMQMVELTAAKVERPEEKILAVSHCNCPERAKMVKDALAQKAGFKDIIVLDTAGVSSMYANDGGVIVVV